MFATTWQKALCRSRFPAGAIKPACKNTPLREAVGDVGLYYATDYDTDIEPDTSPYADDEGDPVDGAECMQSFAVLLTDGYWNGENPWDELGNQDGDQDYPYKDNYENTLADLAMILYKNDIAPGVPNELATNPCDRSSHQHMVVYAIAFGVTGTLDHLHWTDRDGDGEQDDPCLLYSSCHTDNAAEYAAADCPVWPDPNFNEDAADQSQEAIRASRAKIDDLWHIALNGRGAFYNASNPAELVESFESVIGDISEKVGSAASFALNQELVTSDTRLYQTSLTSFVWTGDVIAYVVTQNESTGSVSLTESWRASDNLEGVAQANRQIVTYNGSAGIPFRWGSLTEDQRDVLESENMLKFLRGDVTFEGTQFRQRVSILGDIVHSAPVLVGDTVFAGGNDGMLHAFNTADGTERFAYVPNLVFGTLTELAQFDYNHKLYVDLTPVVAEHVTGLTGRTGERRLLIGGLGKGGRGYYALDITDADSVVSSTGENTVKNMVVWEYPGSTTPAGEKNHIGYSFSKAFVVRSNDPSHPWVVIFGNGYNSPTGRAVLLVLDVNGVKLRMIDTGVGSSDCSSPNGLSTPVLIDTDNDGKVDYCYAGDLQGNLWKFDLTSNAPANWDVAFKDGSTSKPLFQAKGPGGTLQPITTKPDVMKHCEQPGRMVVFGTGKYLDVNELSDDTTTQSVYGIWDYSDDADAYLGSFDLSGRDDGSLTHPPNSDSDIRLLKQEVRDNSYSAGHDLRTLTQREANWDLDNPTVGDEDGRDNDKDGATDEPDEAVAHVGWYFDFPVAGERVIKDPAIRDGKVTLISVREPISYCSSAGTSVVHVMDACTGGALDEPQFSIDADYLLDYIETQSGEVLSPTGISFEGILSPAVILRRGKNLDEYVFGSTDGAPAKLPALGERLGIIYWREIY